MISVEVRHGDILAAMRVLKKKLDRDGSAGEMKIRNHAKPSQRRKAKEEEAVRRRKKSERRKRQREAYSTRMNKRRKAKAA